MSARPALSVLIPAYNERAGLAQSVEAVKARLGALNVDWEILIVDDGSRDGTGQIADALAVDVPHLRALHHAKNQGIGAAFKTGVAQARGEWLILIPADLALDPEELRKYLDAARSVDVVVGNRSDISDYSSFRRLVHNANIRLIQVLFQMPLHQYQYISMYRLATLNEMDIEYTGSAFFLAEILIKARALGARLAEVDIRYLPRRTGQATGARWRQIVITLRDIGRFWWRWAWLGPVTASRRRAYALKLPPA
jgi:glycosyltransferase involved in cell wall biosynthesis